MADITPSRIEPLGDGPSDSQARNSRRKPVMKAPATLTPVPEPPAIEDEKELHQLDELA